MFLLSEDVAPNPGPKTETKELPQILEMAKELDTHIQPNDKENLRPRELWLFLNHQVVTCNAEITLLAAKSGG